MKIMKQHFNVLTPVDVYKDFVKETEKIARVCYKSENKITDKATTENFVRKLIENGHEAMLEHCSLTVKFITDRATANALVRHRHCAFAQESTHYINYKKRGELTFIIPNAFKDIQYLTDYLTFVEQWYNNCDDEKALATRAMLPLTLKTELTVTTNLREWRHILRIRTTKDAHPQMRELMSNLLDWFKAALPIFVEDIYAYKEQTENISTA